MEFTTLASSSSGNCIYVCGGNTRILIDAGCSAAYLKRSLASIDVSLETITALLITHEHCDHINGAAKINKQYGIPIFASRLTWNNLPFTAEIPECQRHIFAYDMTIGELSFDFFKLFHDAVQPVGMIISHNNSKLGVVTDTGKVSDSMLQLLIGADGLIFEANYDQNMLEDGDYPYFLKQRIKSFSGHLSNQQAAEAIAAIVSDRTKEVLLAHLSRSNNTPHAAITAVEQRLRQAVGCNNLTVSVAPAKEPHRLLQI